MLKLIKFLFCSVCFDTKRDKIARGAPIPQLGERRTLDRKVAG